MLAHRIIVLMSISVLLVGIFRGENPYKRYWELIDSKIILQDAVEDLSTDVDHLTLEIKRIEKSPSYARRVFRDKYHITEENESIVFFAD